MWSLVNTAQIKRRRMIVSKTFQSQQFFTACTCTGSSNVDAKREVCLPSMCWYDAWVLTTPSSKTLFKDQIVMYRPLTKMIHWFWMKSEQGIYLNKRKQSTHRLRQITNLAATERRVSVCHLVIYITYCHARVRTSHAPNWKITKFVTNTSNRI